MVDSDILDRPLLYFGLDDFFKRRESIKELYISLDRRTKCIYKLYVYSRAYITEYWKNIIWDYLNDNVPEHEIVLAYGDEKRKKRRQI